MVISGTKFFTEGGEDVNDYARLGHSRTLINDENIVIQNCSLTIRELVDNLVISVGSCHAIFQMF